MVNTGSWVYCGFAFDPNYVEGYDAAIYVNGIPEYVSNLTNRQYDNDANLIIALRSRETFDGQLDKISFFGPLLGRVDIGDAFGVYSTSSNTLFERGDTTENIWGFGLISDLRYLCNDGNGTTITEEKFGWNGLIVDSGGDFWQPELNIRLHPDPIESYRRQRSYEFLNYNRETIPLNNDLKKVGSQRY
jgi:hypothetical protein